MNLIISRLTLVVVFAASIAASIRCPAEALELKSPDGRLVASFELQDFANATQCATYRLTWNGKPILDGSRLGLGLEGQRLSQGFRVVNQKSTSRDETWRPVNGERSEIRDHYQQLTVTLEQTASPHRRLVLTFRAYNEGLAYRYTVPAQDGLTQVTVNRERSEFRFPADHKTWEAYSAQANYKPTVISALKSGCERPLTIEAAEDVYVAVGEAGLVDYARMKFGPLPGTPHALVSELQGDVRAPLPLTTPWRVVMVADRPGRLFENNFLFLNLNEPCAIADTSWIKPGKVIREVTLTTEGGKACVDFAAKRNIDYVHFDAGWYGNEYDDASDATTITVDPKRSKGPLDLHEVIAYAKKKGVGIIVYVNRRALEKQLDEILPLYHKWGIVGVKFGFVNVGSQRWTSWLHDAIRKAADNHLMVDVHDEYRPTGYERTYPNLMTAEGIAGDETSPKNTNTLTLLFSRMLCGPADNTVCYYDSRVTRNASHAYQLAKAVCLYSPWQYLYWYDRPAALPRRSGGAGGSQNVIGDEPELEFFDALPTTWDETRVIRGRIGEYAVIARRKGQEWFIGAMNSTVDRTLDVPLDFLPAGTAYIARVYVDDPSVNTFTKVRIDRRPVDAKTVLHVSMSAQGGQAIRITPVP